MACSIVGDVIEELLRMASRAVVRDWRAVSLADVETGDGEESRARRRSVDVMRGILEGARADAL